MNDRPHGDSKGALWGTPIHESPVADIPQADTDLRYSAPIRDLTAAAKSDSDRAVRGCIDALLVEGLAPQTLTEICIPEVSRRLGAEWVADVIGFDRVTIGCARLMMQLRRLQARVEPALPIDPAQVLTIVADGADHTLGATVLAGILRRKGLDVTLWVGRSPMELETALDGKAFDAVVLSASTGESLEHLQRLVDCIRASTPGTPIVAGGTFFADANIAQMQRALGVDAISQDTDTVIALCKTTNCIPMDPKHVLQQIGRTP